MEDDKEYYSRRAEQEKRFAELARNDDVKAIHLELASHYLVRSDLASGRDLRTLSELNDL